MKRMKIKEMRIRKDNLLFIFILLLYTAAATHKYLTYLGLFVCTVIFWFITMKSVPMKSIFLPKLILLLLLFQNTCIGIGARFGGNMDNSIQLLTQIPTILILLSSIYIFFSKKVTNQWWFIIYALLIISYVFVGNAHIETAVVYLRNFLIFFLGFIIGKNNLDSEEKRKAFINFYIKLAVFAGIFGLVGIVWGDEFFNMLGVREVYLGKNWHELTAGSTPGNFRTLFFGQWVNRMASFYFEPVNFSYFMFLATMLAYFMKKYTITIFLFICSVLTFGKGGALVIGLTVMAVFMHTLLGIRVNKANRNRILFLMLFVFSALVMYLTMFRGSDFGTHLHFYGFFSAVPTIIRNPLGHGLGSAGNVLRSNLGTRTFEATESALATMGYQIGIVGLSLFILLMHKIGKEPFHALKEQVGKSQYILCLASSYLAFALLLGAVFQENMLSPQCAIPFMLIIGSFGAVDKERRRERYVLNKMDKTI